MPNSPIAYDAIVLGSGQGGNPLAQKLASEGKRVAVVEARHLGGTCINTGCTPTKTMVASAQVAHYARNAARWGVHTTGVSVDFAAVIERKRKMVSDFRSGWETKFSKQPTLTVHHGVGSFVGPRQVEVNGAVLESERIFIDTGSSTTVPPIEGIAESGYLTNETLMELETLPTHLIVIGGGYIGLEFGQMFRRFGSEVTVIQAGSHLLGDEEPEVIAELQGALEAEGIRFLLKDKVVRVERDKGEIRVTVQTDGGSETLAGSHLLLAAGRIPNTQALHLEKAGVTTDEHGFIQVNEKLETTAPGIWAIGDVKGGPAFTHISYNDFQIIYGNVYEGQNLSTRDRIVPYAVFTDPQLGRVGITEAHARKAGHAVKTGSVPMTSVARGIERGETRGLMKIVVDAKTDLVLGASILAPEGGEVVQILHTLMLAQQPYTLLKGAIYIHPTIAEGFFSLLESVQ